MPKRDRYVWVCVNRRTEDNPKGSCAQKGSEAFHQKLKNAVAEAGMHGKVRVCTSSCLDLCWVGISVAVMPDMTFLKHMTEADVPTMVDALRSTGNIADFAPLKDKIVRPEEFDDPAKGVVKLGTKRSA